uniref:Uncharacterized protein n=1 Tax=Pseudoalteromonas undina TaxID=43660 RepID=A0ABP2XXK0_9GAMM
MKVGKSKQYGIDKQLWIDSYLIFKFADKRFVRPKVYTEAERNKMNSDIIKPMHFEGSQVTQKSTGFKLKRTQ